MRKIIFGSWGVLLLGVIVTTEVKGIPNSFGVVGFTNVVGMNLEDFVARAETWDPKADLKGTWEIWKDEAVTDQTIELLHLNMPATVFGIPASEVTVQRRDDKILQFRVVFAPYDQVKDFNKLKRTIKTNAALWSGGSASSDAMKQGASIYTFKEESAEKRVVVTITPAP